MAFDLSIFTFSIAGAIELGPLDENCATFASTGLPTIVLEGLNFTTGDLHIINQGLRIKREPSSGNHERR
jgi:hypothetical protein